MDIITLIRTMSMAEKRRRAARWNEAGARVLGDCAGATVMVSVRVALKASAWPTCFGASTPFGWAALSPAQFHLGTTLAFASAHLAAHFASLLSLDPLCTFLLLARTNLLSSFECQINRVSSIAAQQTPQTIFIFTWILFIYNFYIFDWDFLAEILSAVIGIFIATSDGFALYIHSWYFLNLFE